MKLVAGAGLAGLAVGGLIALFIMRGCEGEKEGEIDERVIRQIETSARQRDSALALAARQGAALDELRRQRAVDTAGIAALRRDIQQVTATTGQLRRDVAGIIRLSPRPGSSDTAELVGPRTAAHIFKQDSIIVDLRDRRLRDSTDIEKLFAGTDSLRRANRQLDSAYQSLDSAFSTVSKQKYGWKDRVTVNVCYGLLATGERGFCGSLGYTVVRPLRVLDRLPRWLGGI